MGADLCQYGGKIDRGQGQMYVPICKRTDRYTMAALQFHHSHGSPTQNANTALEVPAMEEELKQKILELAGIEDEMPDLEKIRQPRIRQRKQASNPFRGSEAYYKTRAKARGLRGDSIFFEFGKEVHADREDELEDYLRSLNDWITNTRFPKKYASFCAYARRYVNSSHRRVALCCLATRKVGMAKLILLASSGSLKKETFEAWTPQTTDGIIFGTVALSMIAILAYYAERFLQRFQPINRTAEAINSVVDAVGSVSSATQKACKKVYAWFKDLLAKLKQLLKDTHTIVRKTYKKFLIVVAFVLAVAYAATVFPDIVQAVRAYLMAVLGFQDSFEAQAGEEDWGVLHDIVEFFRFNCLKTSYKKFWRLLDKLPKFVSIAKSVQWIFENVQWLFYTMLEAITGKKYPKNQSEQRIMSFVDDIETLYVEFTAADSMTLHAGDFACRITDLACRQRKIRESQVVSDKSVRPFFGSAFNEASRKFLTLQKDFELKSKECRKRPIPVWVYFRGPKGVGKSYLQERLMTAVWQYLLDYSSIVKGEFSNAQIYVVPQKETYFDGYEQQPFVLIDDLFQQRGVDARSDLAAQLINMVSPTPYSLLVASPEQKGHKHFTSIAIFTSTNMQDVTGRGSRVFGGADLGLEDPTALADRRTIIIDMQQRGQYQLIGTLNGKRDPMVSFEEIVALTGEAIISRHAEFQVPVPKIQVPRFQGTFAVARLQIDRSEDDSSSDDYESSEDDESEKEGEREVLEPQAGEDEIDLDEDTKGKEQASEEDLEQMKKTRAAHEMRDIEDEIELTPEESAAEKRRKRAQQLRTYEEQAANSRQFHGPTGRDFYVDDTAFFGKADRLFKYARDVDKAIDALEQGEYLEGKNFQDLLPEVSRKIKYRAPCADDRVLSTLLSNETVLPNLQAFPGAYLYPVGLDGVHLEETGQLKAAWTSWLMASMFVGPQTASIEPKPRESYWRELLAPHWKHLVMTWVAQGPEFYRAARKASRERRAIINTLLQFYGLTALAAYGVWKMLRLLMPAAAYEPQAKYDTDKVAKQRKAMNRRARMRERVRIAQAPVRLEAQGQGAINVLSHAMVPMTVIQGIRTQTSWALGIGSRDYLAPGHLVPDGEFDLRVGDSDLGPDVTYPSTSLTVTACASDVVIITLPKDGSRQCRDIRNHFLEEVPDYGDLALLHPVQGVWCLTRGTSWDRKIMNVVVEEGYEYEVDLLIQSIPNTKGFCGLPYIHLPTGKIVGVHMAGCVGTAVAGAVTILKEDLTDFGVERETFFTPDLAAQSIPGIHVQGRVHQSLGSYVPKFSRLVRTPLDPEGLPFQESNDEPALLDEKDGVSPLRLAIDRFADTGYTYRLSVLSDFREMIPRGCNPSRCRRLTLEEAIYGVPGWIDAVDFTASSGYLYKRMKHTRRSLCFNRQGLPEVHPVLRADINQRLRLLEEGKFKPVIYEETLKDELRPLEKVKTGQTRLFAAGDFAGFIVTKMILGTLYVECNQDPVETPSGLGLNPHSSQWGRVYTNLRKDPSYVCVAGDQSQYDMRRKNDGEEDFIRFLSLLTDDPLVPLVVRSNAEGEHILGTLIFDRYAGTNSGSFLTSWLNTFDNWRRHRLLFEELYSEGFELLGKKFVGDDSILGVPPQYAEYNMSFLAKRFKERWNMKYTAPDKSNATSVTWKEVEFLKRRFVPGHAGIMAPLREQSIQNMVKWTEREFTSEKAESVVNAVLLEAWHYGQDRYEQVLEWISRERKRLGYAMSYPDWVGMWILRSKDYEHLPTIDLGMVVKPTH